MNIAYICMRFPTPSETFARRDVEALRELGYQVQVHSLLRPAGVSWLRYVLGCVWSLFFSPGLVPVVHLAVRILTSRNWILSERLKCLALLPAAAAVSRRLVQGQPDVVHLFWGHYPALVTLLAKPLLPRTRFSLFLGAYDLELRLPLSNWAAGHSDVIFTHARANLGALHELLGEIPVQTIHRGLELSAYPSVDLLDFEHRPLQIFTAGRLIPEKGFDKVIECFAGIVAECPAARLVIAGTGPDLDRLVALRDSLDLAVQVEFAGWLSEEEVRRQLLRSRAFVLLSSKTGERLPNSVKEAMAAGCIAIASDSPGIDELIDSGVDGFISTVDDSEAVKAAVRFAFHNSGAAEMSRAAAVKIREAFDVRQSAQQYIRCWRRKIGR